MLRAKCPHLLIAFVFCWLVIPSARGQEIKTVFVIAMENHNWTQPANKFSGGIQQIYKNPNAPFINSLVDGSATAMVNGSVNKDQPASRLCNGVPQRPCHAEGKQSSHSSV